jgi:hypothetical protein
MVTYSSNLATNLVLERVGRPAVERIWDAVGARHSAVRRGLGDTAAADAGITNDVTAADLAALFRAIARGELVGSDEMLATLLDQRRTEDLAAGLPAGTRVAHKNGWIMGVRHGAGVVFPGDAPPFVLSVCLTTPWASTVPMTRLVRSSAGSRARPGRTDTNSARLQFRRRSQAHAGNAPPRLPRSDPHADVPRDHCALCLRRDSQRHGVRCRPVQPRLGHQAPADALLAGVVIFAAQEAGRRPLGTLLAALGCATAGDVALMADGTLPFLLGMAAFLGARCC